MKFEIVTDSAANLSEELIDKYHLTILPLCFYVDGKECCGYEKGKQTDLSSFYAMMREKKNITTSLVNTELAENVCDEILSQGKDILYIGFSSGLSGTFQSVKVALDDLKEKYPDRKIYYVDTLAAALGEGLLVRYAIDLREEGKEIEEVCQWLEDNRLNLCHWFTVDDLFFLKRGGRISATTAILGTALSIKPVLHVDDEGHLIMMGKARGRKKSLDALLEKMKETAFDTKDQYIYISHGDCLSDAEYLAEKIKENFQAKEVFVRVLDPVIGAHSGPGTVALFFMGSKR